MSEELFEPVIFTAEGITKNYKTTKAIDNASFEVKKGRIYGFIGQNGAGKTTFIRLITGMARPDSGKISLFGKYDEKGISEGRKRIGCIIEHPTFYPNMTAKDNIKIQMLLYDIDKEGYAEELLEMVGLKDTGKKKAKDFSLGMRQRLGIAMALVNNPEFLILDEPINGLDPVGIKEVRELLLRLNRERGITVLISSHILSELYQLATDYIIIHKGSIISEMTMQEIDAKCEKYLAIKTPDLDKAKHVLSECLNITEYREENGILKVYGCIDRQEEVARTMMEEKVVITGLDVDGDSLEEYYLNLIGGASK